MEELPEGLAVCPELNVTFRSLSYSLPVKGGKLKDVLHDVSGDILSGRLTAIMGASGAGKTSLLNVLAGFQKAGVRGSVLVNGTKRNQSEFRTQSCYITQGVFMLEVLTAQETLIIAAKLKLSHYTDQIGKCVVSDILELLNLTQCRDTKVENMSGGEQKRLSIGIELITNPPVMFFDEPTSGLDSVSSNQVITHLRSLAKSGRTVACVIHQPSSKLCHMFDDIILMSSGRILYCGSMDQMVPVLEGAGFAYPKDYNRADFALEVACGERGDDLSGLLERFSSSSEQIHDEMLYIIPPTKETNMLLLEATAIPVDTKLNGTVDDHAAKSSNKKIRKRYANGFFRQFQVLLHRSLIVAGRERLMSQMRLLLQFFVAFLLGAVCFDVGNDAAKIFTNASSLFFVVIFTYFINSMVSALMYPQEMFVLLRELRNNWYSLTAYFVAKCISNVPLQVICPSILVSIAYFMTGQPHDITRFTVMLFVVCLMGLMAQMTGMAFGVLFGAELGIFMLPASSIPMLLFSGYFVRLPDLSSSFRWIAEVSYFKHGFEAAMGVIYGGNRSPLVCSEAFCFFKYPVKFLEHLGLHEENLGYNVSMLLIWAVVAHVTVYASLMWRLRNVR